MELVPSIRLLHPSEPARRGPREFGSLRASSEAEALSAQMLVRTADYGKRKFIGVKTQNTSRRPRA
jgi:hypothetical protein